MSIKDASKRASRESLKGKNPPPDVASEGALRDPRVQTVIDLMNANLHRRIPLTEFADVASLSLFRLSHLFKTETGLPPGEFLRRLRMERARHLVATTRLSIKEIMASVGYYNKSHFVHHFKRSFGLSPSKFRKRILTL